MADIIGIPDTRYAVEVAAAGGHHLMLTGPKGAGKTSIAERIPTLLPDLADDESLELTAVHSLAGVLPPGGDRLRRPLFRAPHHSASRTGILGGGSGRVRPGEVSRAHLGVLFLDEFPLFPVDVIEALREPLESGEISISRGEDDAVYPARAMFVFACNPCRCGAYHPYARDHDCRCSERARREYRAKISGPIADRIDITRFVEPMHRDDLLPFERRETSAEIRARVEAARDCQRAPLRRTALAAQRARTRPPPAAAVAPRRHRDDPPRGRGARREADEEGRSAGAPCRVVGGGPGRSSPDPACAELDVALRLRRADPLPLGGIPRRVREAGIRVMVADVEADRLARVTLSKVGEPGHPRLADAGARARREHGAGRRSATTRSRASSAPTWPSGSRRSTRRGSCSKAARRRAAVRRTRGPGVAGVARRPGAGATPARPRRRADRALVPRCPMRLDEVCRAVGGRGRLALGHLLRRPGRRRHRRHPGS